MKQGEFEQTKPINPDLLNDELKAALGPKLLKLETGIPKRVGFMDKSFIIMVTTDDVTEDEISRADAVIEAHKPDGLSKQQQRDKDKAEAEERLNAVDLKAIRALTGKAQTDAILSLLEDLLKTRHKGA